MIVLRQLTGKNGDIFHAANFSENPRGQARAIAVATVDRRFSAKVGQRKCSLAVAAVSRTYDGKKRLVLTNRQKLSAAVGPPARGKVAGKHCDMTEKRSSHDGRGLKNLIAGGKDALETNDIVQSEKRRQVIMGLSAAGNCNA